MDQDPLKLFGQHVIRLRKLRGWSQEALALESGLARSYVSGIERGKRNVSLLNICVLAETLGVSPSDMLVFDNGGHTEQRVADYGRGNDPLPVVARVLGKMSHDDQVWVAGLVKALGARLKPPR